ncbi:MAG: ABC transporter permease [Bacteroidales bacterium]|nr:ABC transporter permease [Bacteroidales bacterium]
MRKLTSSVYKETILLLRDIEGVALLFVMPLFLVIVIALLQHKTFQNILEAKIPVVILDNDNDSLGYSFRKGLQSSKMFEVKEFVSPDSNEVINAKQAVAKGEYQIGIIIPANSTERIKTRALSLVQKQLPNAIQIDRTKTLETTTVELFFDPLTKNSFRDLTKSKMNEFAATLESQFIFETYSKVIDALTNQNSNLTYHNVPALVFDEILIAEFTAGKTPNAVQHNVPAYTLFGMFLICIPIAGNILKERNDGCLARLKTMPISYLEIMTGKTIVFVVICLLQALLIVLVGRYFMPLIDLPALQIGTNIGALSLMSLASALAATGYGIAIGSIASTHVQASTFGSISTVILAAIGGVWIPVMLMPDVMRFISEISPLNWGIKGYYAVFLRDASTIEVLPEAAKLIFFHVACLLVSFVFRRYK